MTFLRLSLFFFLGLLAPAAFGNDAYLWLQRMNQASHVLNYTGVFLYQSQGRSETSYIVHLVDASGEHERLETLDGSPREVVRHNDDVQCFLPQDRVVVNDRLLPGRLPGRLIARPVVLAEFYTIRLGGVARVAGRDSQQLVLEPRDDMRYGHQLWIDVASGLLLRSQMFNEQGEALEQFSFSEITIGGDIDHEKLKPKAKRSGEWRVINARGVELLAEDSDWVFRKLPPGFRRVSLLKRPVRRGGENAVHAVFSDGLANVSVFVETLAGGASATPSLPVGAGSTGVYRRVVGDRMVTVLGEVPALALQRIAEGVERRSR